MSDFPPELPGRIDEFSRRLAALEQELEELRRLTRHGVGGAGDPSLPRGPSRPRGPSGARRRRAASSPVARRAATAANDAAPCAQAVRLVGVPRCQGARLGRRRGDAPRHRLLLRPRGEPRVDRPRGARHARLDRLGRRFRRRRLRQAPLRRPLRLRARRCRNRHRRGLHDPPGREDALRPRPRLGRPRDRGRDRRSRCRDRSGLVVRADRGPWIDRRDTRAGRDRAPDRGPDRSRHRLRGARLRGNCGHLDQRAVAQAARGRRRRQPAAGRRPRGPGRADRVGRRLRRRLLLAALPRCGDRVARPARHRRARLVRLVAHPAQRRLRGPVGGSAVRRPARGLGAARGCRRLRGPRRIPAPGQAAPRPERTARSGRARDRGVRIRRSPLGPVTRNRVGCGRGRAGVACTANPGASLPARLARLSRGGRRARGRDRRAAQAALRGRRDARRRRARPRRRRARGCDRRLVLPPVGRGAPVRRHLRAVRASAGRFPRQPGRLALDHAAGPDRWRRSTRRRSACSGSPSGSPPARSERPSSGATSA